MRRGTGHLLDSPEHQEEDRLLRPMVDEAVGLFRPEHVGSFARSREWRHLVDRVYDQHQSESCVLWFVSSAVYLRGRVMETEGLAPRVARPSVLHAWAGARWLDQAQDGVPVARRALENVGCRPRNAFLAAETHGLVAEERWPFDPADMNVPPPIDTDLSGADARLTGWYTVGGGTGSFDALCAASDRGHFPGLALDVYDNFYDYNGTETYDAPRGERRGSHMLTVVGYRPDEMLIQNSWGMGWGDGGYAWFSRRLIESSFVKSRMVVTAAPATR